jgi:acyl transferase domain-containing protein
VGGVNLMLAPDSSIFLCKARALAPDGRCKTFDASANGYGRAEGCGVVVLRRLSDTAEHRDPVLAVVRGSAVNHDGPSSAFTVPNGKAQAAVIRAALENGGVDPGQVSCIEAHGTGTPLGDPIEVQALAEVLGRRDEGQPIYLQIRRKRRIVFAGRPGRNPWPSPLTRKSASPLHLSKSCRVDT